MIPLHLSVSSFPTINHLIWLFSVAWALPSVWTSSAPMGSILLGLLLLLRLPDSRALKPPDQIPLLPQTALCAEHHGSICSTKWAAGSFVCKGLGPSVLLLQCYEFCQVPKWLSSASRMRDNRSLSCCSVQSDGGGFCLGQTCGGFWRHLAVCLFSTELFLGILTHVSELSWALCLGCVKASRFLSKNSSGSCWQQQALSTLSAWVVEAAISAPHR